MIDPLDTPEVRAAANAAWDSILEFERKVGWTEDDERALAEFAGRMRESGDR